YTCVADFPGAVSVPPRFSHRPVIVEMWATWCPPCRSTMAWLPSLQKKYGDRLTIVAIAVDSSADEVAKTVAALQVNYPVVMGSPDVIAAFGAVAAVPKLLVFDRQGRRSQVL